MPDGAVGCVLLLFPQEVDDEFLIVLDKVVRQPLILEILPETFSPLRVECVQ